MKALVYIIFFLSLVIILCDCQQCVDFSYTTRPSCSPDLLSTIAPFEACHQNYTQYQPSLIDLYRSGANPPYKGQPLDIEIVYDNTDVSIVFIHLNGGNEHAFGFYKIDGATGDISDTLVLYKWRDSAYTNGCTSYGDTIKIGQFNKGDKLSFFYMCSEQTEYCPNIEKRYCSNPEIDPDNCYETVYSTPFHIMNVDVVLLGIEDFDMTSAPCCNDLVFALEPSKKVFYPTLPVYDEEEGKDAIRFCVLRDVPDAIIHKNDVTFAFFNPLNSNTSAFPPSWNMVTDEEFAELLAENPDLNEQCLYTLDPVTETIQSYNCEDSILTKVVSNCYDYPENTRVLLKKTRTDPICVSKRPDTFFKGEYGSFVLFTGHDLDAIEFLGTWVMPSSEEVAKLLQSNPILNHNCLITINRDAQSTLYNCDEGVSLTQFSPKCYQYPSDAYVLFKEITIDSTGGRCVTECEIEHNLVFDEGSVLVLENAVAKVSSTVELKEQGVLEFVGPSSHIQTTGSGTLIIEGGTVIINIIEKDEVDTILDVERLIASGNLQYNKNVTVIVNFAGSIELDSDISGSAVLDGSSLSIVFNVSGERSGIPWWAIMLITIGCVLVLTVIALVVILTNKNVRSKVMPFR